MEPVSLAAPAGTSVVTNPRAGLVQVWSPYTRELAGLSIQAGESGAAALAGLLALDGHGKAHGRMLPSGAAVLVLCMEDPTDPAEWQRSLGVETV